MTEDSSFKALERFDKVDTTGEHVMFINFLSRVEELPDVVKRRHRSFELLELKPGDYVVDVGCGIGTAAMELSSRVGASGHAMGVDLSAAMIAEAKSRASVRGATAEFVQGSADSLPLETGSVQAYRAERLYQHLESVESSLAEAQRVLTPGGRIVLVDQDWDLTILDADDRVTSREIHRAFSDSFVQGTIGRRFRRLLLDAAFRDVIVEAETVTNAMGQEYGFVVDLWAKSARSAGVDSERVDAWVEDQRRRLATDRFLLIMTHFLARGVRA